MNTFGIKYQQIRGWGIPDKLLNGHNLVLDCLLTGDRLSLGVVLMTLFRGASYISMDR